MTEKFKLDLKDKKILFELDSNARSPCSQIAKRVGLSTEVVNYRIKKLEDEKIITQYQIIVNLSKLNIIQFKICLSFVHLTSTKLEEIISLLKQNKYIKWIVSCKGNWDLLISLETDSIENVNMLKDEVLSFFEGYINQKSISILVEAETYNRNYLLDNKTELSHQRIIMKRDTKIQLDELDYDILKLLSQNARLQITEISSKLKSTTRMINYRIKQMEKNKIILGYKIALNYELLGIQFFKTFIYLDNVKKERVDALTNYLKVNKNIIHNVKVLGNWDIEPEFEVYAEEEFNKLLIELKDNFSDIIKNIDMLTITKEHKFVYF